MSIKSILAAACLFTTFIARAIYAGNALPQPQLTIPLEGVEGRIDHMALNEKNKQLLIAALGNNTIEVIDLSTNKQIHTIKGSRAPQGLAFLPDSQRWIAASGNDGQCRIYDASFQKLAEIDALDDADNVRYDPSTKLAIVGYGDGALAFIDPTKGVKIREIRLAAHPESFQLEEKGPRIFVNIPEAHQVAVIDRAQNTVTATWKLTEAQSNFPMALDETHHRLFIGCRSPAKLLVLDTETGATLTALNIVSDTDDVFYNPIAHQIYISGGGGFVTVITQHDADHYTIAGQVPTASGARTSFFVPTSHMLYVAVPHRGSQKAELVGLKIPSSDP